MMIVAPLFCMQTKVKKFIYNLNIYRNAHYRTLSSVKIKYKAQVYNQLELMPAFTRIGLTFILYPKTRRKTDLTNVCCIHDKFFADALVESGKIPDDDYKHIVETNYRFGGVDPTYPRVEIYITEIKE
jgi:hypothetical protein